MRAQAEQIVLQLRELLQVIAEVMSQPDLGSKRQKLNSVAKAIQQLESGNESIPEELRMRRSSLADEVRAAAEAEAARVYLRNELVSLTKQLGIPEKKHRAGRNRGREPDDARVRRLSARELGEDDSVPKVLRDVLAVVRYYQQSHNLVHAFNRRAKEVGINQTTIRDACTRRLGGINTDQFRSLLDKPDELRGALSRVFREFAQVIDSSLANCGDD